MPVLQVYLPEQTYSALMGVAEGRALTGPRMVREVLEGYLQGDSGWIGNKSQPIELDEEEKEELLPTNACPSHGLKLVFQGTDVVCAECRRPYLA